MTTTDQKTKDTTSKTKLTRSLAGAAVPRLQLDVAHLMLIVDGRARGEL
jgi:hypothetical protein